MFMEHRMLIKQFSEIGIGNRMSDRLINGQRKGWP